MSVYEQRYTNFIQHCRTIEEQSKENYTELHHIIPRCIGGTDFPSNLVRIPARHHLVAHYILAKIYGGDLWYAYIQMSKPPKRLKGRVYKLNSRLYAKAKEEYSKVVSERFLGVSKTEEHKQNLSNAHKKLRTFYCTITDIETSIDTETVSEFLMKNPSFVKGRCNRYKASRELSVDKIRAGSLERVVVIDENGISKQISKEEFDTGEYNGVTKGMIVAMNETTGERVHISTEEFHSNDNFTHHRKETVIVYDTRSPGSKAFQTSQDDPLYLDGTYINVGKAQGLKQTGKNNPNCTGAYVTPHGKFYSPKEFEERTSLKALMLSKRCKSNSIITKSVLAKTKDYGIEILGLTWKELGWSFIPKGEEGF